MKVVTVILCFMLSGCLKTRINFEEPVNARSYPSRQSFFLAGLLPEKRTFKVSEVCPDGNVAHMETITTFLDGFLTVITLTIYSPKTLTITCNGAQDAKSI